jgi:hypothetical protein
MSGIELWSYCKFLGSRSGGYEGFCLWAITSCCQLKITDVSEEHIASIFMFEEEAEQEISVKLVASPRWFLAWLILRT